MLALSSLLTAHDISMKLFPYSGLQRRAFERPLTTRDFLAPVTPRALLSLVRRK